MSQAEPYVVVHRTGSGVKTGRNFAQKANAVRWAKKNGYNTVAQKRKGSAGLRIVAVIPKATK